MSEVEVSELIKALDETTRIVETLAIDVKKIAEILRLTMEYVHDVTIHSPGFHEDHNAISEIIERYSKV